MEPKRERWPPVYDFEGLKEEIDRLRLHPDVVGQFYEWRRDRSTVLLDDVCQGDVLSLAEGIPILDADGPAVLEHVTEHWMVIGNTCDFERNVAWTQLVPIEEPPLLTVDERAAATSYKQSRRFFLPSWRADAETRTYVADLVRPVTADKALFLGSAPRARVEARLGRAAWHLLNACLVRFLARDDGRYD